MKTIKGSFQTRNDLREYFWIHKIETFFDFQDRMIEMFSNQTEKSIFDIMFSSFSA